MVFNDKKILEVIGECYRRMYKETEPVGDIDKIKKSGEGKMEGFFMAYYLDQKRQDEIMAEVIKKLKVPKNQVGLIERSVWLGASPSGNKEATKASRLTHDRRLKRHLIKQNDALKQEGVKDGNCKL